MVRIVCRQPSTGKPVNAVASNVGVNYVIVAEAPDFSVPDPSGSQYPNRDPLDTSRGIAAGEIFFLTPMLAKNKTANTCWIELRLTTENGANNDAFGRIVVPSGETATIPLQGRSLIKANSTSSNGDTLLVRAQEANSFDVWVSANEQAAAEHVGIET